MNFKNIKEIIKTHWKKIVLVILIIIGISILLYFTLKENIDFDISGYENKILETLNKIEDDKKNGRITDSKTQTKVESIVALLKIYSESLKGSKDIDQISLVNKIELVIDTYEKIPKQ